METENTNSENRKRADWPVFHEYTNNKPNLPFISVTSSVEGKRFVIGRIRREYDNENQRAVYTAIDGLGNPIFTDIPDLVSIKKEFVNQRENLAMVILNDRTKQKDVEHVQPESRRADLKKTRDQQQSKYKTKKIER